MRVATHPLTSALLLSALSVSACQEQPAPAAPDLAEAGSLRTRVHALQPLNL